MLLIDEIDKSDQEFEAFLLEILSDYQVTVPEIGSISAATPPIVLLTSNSTRDLGDALKRRCLHLHIGFPDERLEARIIASRVPGIDVKLLRQLVSFVQQLRTLDLKKLPSVSETLDWAKVMVLMHTTVLEVGLARDTLNVLLKFEADIEAAGKQLAGIVNKAQREALLREQLRTIRTELGGGLTDEFAARLAGQTALGRVGEPDDAHGGDAGCHVDLDLDRHAVNAEKGTRSDRRWHAISMSPQAYRARTSRV